MQPLIILRIDISFLLSVSVSGDHSKTVVWETWWPFAVHVVAGMVFLCCSAGSACYRHSRKPALLTVLETWGIHDPFSHCVPAQLGGREGQGKNRMPKVENSLGSEDRFPIPSGNLCPEGRVLKCARGWVCGRAWCWGENGVMSPERSLSEMWRKPEDRGRAHLCLLWTFCDFLCPIQGGNTLPAKYPNSGEWSLLILEEFKTGNSVCQESDSLGVNSKLELQVWGAPCGKKEIRKKRADRRREGCFLHCHLVSKEKHHFFYLLLVSSFTECRQNLQRSGKVGSWKWWQRSMSPNDSLPFLLFFFPRCSPW